MIPQPALQKFRESLRGQSFCLGEPGYDDARRIPNAMIDRRLDAVANQVFRRHIGGVTIVPLVRRYEAGEVHGRV